MSLLILATTMYAFEIVIFKFYFLPLLAAWNGYGKGWEIWDEKLKEIGGIIIIIIIIIIINLQERDLWGGLGVDGGTILEWTLKR